MNKSVHIVGERGNMGQRYRYVLKHLGYHISGHDRWDYRGDTERKMANAIGFIIATPTQNHLADIKSLLRWNKPILCEKPLAFSSEILNDFETNHKGAIDLITQVNQYDYLYRNYKTHDQTGPTTYDYFKSGKDGLAWDCINIIGLAQGEVTLAQESPIWKCQINGAWLEQSAVDHSYIDMVKDWLENPRSNWEYAKTAHRKVEDWLRLR